MTDFYALLKQSILDRNIRAAADREEVYAQARRAVIKQLWDFRPPLAADEIDMRVGAYDRAVERIEADLRITFANEPPPKKGRSFLAPAKPARKVALEAVRLATYAANGRGQAAALAEWAREQPDYAPGIERAATYVPAPAAYSPPPPPEEIEEAANDDYLDEEPPYREERLPIQQRTGGLHDRWSTPRQVVGRRAEPSGPPLRLADYLGWLGTPEQIMPRLLAIAIGVLVIVLVGIGAYMLGARSHSVTVDIGVRREVSDAATAARIGQSDANVAQSFALFDGRDPTVFATTPDNPIRFDSTNGFARVSSSTGASGVKVMIGPGLAARLAGRNVRVVIDARSSTDFGAANMRFAYQSGLAISHWQTANLSGDYKELGMEWRVPTMRTNPNGDFLLIEPGIPGDGTGADIKSIRIDVLSS
jgi:hypothetical protein